MSAWAQSADACSCVFILLPFRPDIGVGSDSVCGRHSSAHRIKSFESLSCQASLGRSSKLLQNQFRSLVSTAVTNSTVLDHGISQWNEHYLTFVRSLMQFY